MSNKAPTPENAHSDVLLRMEQIGKLFPSDSGPVPALNDVSLRVSAGEITALVGADGAGKTTLLRCAAGLLQPSAGHFTILGMDGLTNRRQILPRIGYMPQAFGLYKDLTVSENLVLYADLQGIPKQRRKARFEEVYGMTGLGDFTCRRAGALSGGMQQKLGLACALVKEPELLLLDEPTVGVDPVSRRELWAILDRLIGEDDVGVLVSTAYLDETERCHEVLLLHEGRKMLEGRPETLSERLEGRVFVVTPDTGQEPRRIQTEIIADDNVVDATIHRGCVRVLLSADDEGRDARSRLPEAYRRRAEPGSAVFEDVFMDVVPRSAAQKQAAKNAVQVSEEQRKSDVVVHVEDLKKRFGDFEAVRGLSFDVHGGEVFGILGPNGAGKTTTFRMLCGLLPISDGQAEVAGRSLRHSRARARARLGYMAQHFSLYGRLSVLENFRFYGRSYGLRRKRLKERIEWALSEFALDDLKDRSAGSLASGHKQRLAMATALLHEPAILFLGEPTSGVDPLARREFWVRIGSFARQGMTVIVTTHFMEEAEYCDRILIMSKGRALALDTPAEVRNMTATESSPNPSIEDAFVALATGKDARRSEDGREAHP